MVFGDPAPARHPHLHRRNRRQDARNDCEILRRRGAPTTSFPSTTSAAPCIIAKGRGEQVRAIDQIDRPERSFRLLAERQGTRPAMFEGKLARRLPAISPPSRNFIMALGQQRARRPHRGRPSRAGRPLRPLSGRSAGHPRRRGAQPHWAVGTSDECVAKVQEYIDAGVTCPILYLMMDDIAGGGCVAEAYSL